MSSTGSYVGTFNDQLVAVLGKAVESLHGGFPLEEVGYRGGGGAEHEDLQPSPISNLDFVFAVHQDVVSQPHNPTVMNSAMSSLPPS